MISKLKYRLTLFQFENLNCFPEISHFSTSRSGGCSTGKYESLNLGYNCGDHPEKVGQNRQILCNILEIKPENLIFPKQTHTATVKIVSSSFFQLNETEKRMFLQETDALITSLTNVYIAIKTADCVPVLVFDAKKKVVAAIHAGWKGTVQLITQNTIKQMITNFNSDPGDLWAGIGPSISPDVYEVGEEVWSQFDPQFCKPVSPGKQNKRYVDLWGANFEQLKSMGIPEKQIEIAGMCTLTNPKQFFSARRDGACTGRMATLIRLM